ncbi:CHAD domain-containing protein [Kaarinaea lacus]
MQTSQLQFDLNKKLGINAIVNKLREQFSCEIIPTKNLTRVYYDSFDWRLFSKNLQLYSEENDSQYLYSLVCNESPRKNCQLPLAQVAHFSWDFPESRLKKHIEAILEMRALLPVVQLSGRVQEIHLLNNDAKIISRLRIEDCKVDISENKKTTLGKTLRVTPLKGYDKPHQKLLVLLQQQLGLSPSEDDIYVKALSALQKHPGEYSSKLDIPLAPEMRADEATKKILLNLLDTMEINAAGTIADLDSEFLHDFRVAGRRTRSALTQIKDVFTTATLERFKKEFAWLSSITSATRDMDVYLLTFPHYLASVPKDLQTALQPLHQFLEKQQQLEQKKLAKALQSVRYQRLIDSWRKFLQSPTPQCTASANASRPIIELANEHTWKMYKRVMKEGNAINVESPPEDLHEMRKSCKKLRYLLEFFHNLYDSEKISVLVKALKQLQNNLGDYQDLHVQIESLKHFSELMSKDSLPPPITLLAMGTLIENLDRRQLDVRQEFYQRFEAFSLPKFQQLFRQLFNPIDETKRSNEDIASQ